MKRAYIVTYDLINTGKNYEGLIHKIKEYGVWARLGGSSYVIVTEQTAVEIRSFLSEVIDSDDKLFIGVLNAPAAWTGMPENVSNWLRNKLV